MSTLGEILPTVNASLNGLSGILLFSGWRAIRTGRRELHKKLMVAACVTSCVFLVCYLVRISITGAHRYPGDGADRMFYLGLLASHTTLAVTTLPLAGRTLFLSLSDRLVEHRRLARWTFPIWLYVSVTGVVVYVMLYHLAPRWH